MRLSALSIGVLCLMLLQCLLTNDAAAQGKRKKTPKKNGSQAAETESEATPSEGETASGDDASSEEGRGDEEEADGKKTINERLTEEETGGLRRSGRMEFDERLIKGQAAKSGAVYLFKRIPRHLPGLVPMRRSYRSRIVEPILGAVPLKPARYSYELSEKDLEALKAEEEKKAEAAAAEEAAAAAAAEATSATTQEESGTDDAPEEAPAPKKRKRK